MFRVEFDAPANLLRISVWGFLKLEDVTALAAAIGGKARDIRGEHPDFNTIVESLDFPVQANDVADLLGEIGRGGMQLTTGRTAIVVGSHLNKLQAERTHVHPRMKVFTSLEAGRAWLAEAAAAA